MLLLYLTFYLLQYGDKWSLNILECFVGCKHSCNQWNWGYMSHIHNSHMKQGETYCCVLMYWHSGIQEYFLKYWFTLLGLINFLFYRNWQRQSEKLTLHLQSFKVSSRKQINQNKRFPTFLRRAGKMCSSNITSELLKASFVSLLRDHGFINSFPFFWALLWNEWNTK